MDRGPADGAARAGRSGFLVFVNIFVFILAFFLDFFEIAFIVIPLLAPAAEKLGIDLIWFGVLLGANMQTSFMHPPFGFALFYLRGIAPRDTVPSSDIYWGAIPWVVLQLMLVAIVIYWPGSVTYWIDTGPKVDPSKIEIRIPTFNAPGVPNIGQPLSFGTPDLLPPTMPPPTALSPPAVPPPPSAPAQDPAVSPPPVVPPRAEAPSEAGPPGSPAAGGN